MRAGVDEFIVNDQVAPLWQGRQQRFIGGEARAKEQRALRTKEPRRFLFERLVLRVVAAQQAGAARPERNAARKGCKGRVTIFLNSARPR